MFMFFCFAYQFFLTGVGVCYRFMFLMKTKFHDSFNVLLGNKKKNLVTIKIKLPHQSCWRGENKKRITTSLPTSKYARL
jgi:hypothetical protein